MDVDQKLLRQTKFPPEFNQKVDMKKVNIEVMKKWIAGKILEILGSEDDVVTELCFNLLERERFPNIKHVQIQLNAFLDKDTAAFCKELWMLCLSAQSNAQGVPKELLEAKKLELIQEKVDAEKAAEEASRRREQEKARERDIDQIRQKERGEREGARARWGRGRRDDDRLPRRDSRSPPRRRRNSDEFRRMPPRRERDTYIPSGSGRRDERRRRSRTPPKRNKSPSRSRSRSVSPAPRQHRRRATSASRSPHSKRNHNKSPSISDGHGRRRRERRSPDRRRRDSSISPAERSRSRSPRPRPRKRSPSSESRSRTPPDQHDRRRRERHSRSASRPRSLSRRHNRITKSQKSRDSPAHQPNDARELYANVRKDRDRLPRPPKLSPSPARSFSRSPVRTTPLDRERKRRRSIERYDPAAKRRRNTSSPDSSLPNAE